MELCERCVAETDSVLRCAARSHRRQGTLTRNQTGDGRTVRTHPRSLEAATFVRWVRVTRMHAAAADTAIDEPRWAATTQLRPNAADKDRLQPQRRVDGCDAHSLNLAPGTASAMRLTRGVFLIDVLAVPTEQAPHWLSSYLLSCRHRFDPPVLPPLPPAPLSAVAATFATALLCVVSCVICRCASSPPLLFAPTLDGSSQRI